MFRLVVFRNGGTIELDKNPSAAPTAALNELITRELINSSRLSSQAQLKLGKGGEYTARLARSPESDANVALLFPTHLKVADAESVVSDVAKIYESVGTEDPEKFEALVDVRVKNISSIKEPTNNISKARSKDREESEDSKDSAVPDAAAPTKPKTTKTKKLAAATKSKKTKKKRTWEGGSAAEDSDSDTVLDYSESQTLATNYEDNNNNNSSSSGSSSSSSANPPIPELNALDLGEKSKDGFIVKQLTDELGEILSEKENGADKAKEPFGFLRKFVGGKKLDEDDLKGVLTAMEDHLVARNVAKEVAAAICDGLRRDLVGTSTSNWTTVKATVGQSMRRTLSQILTPSHSTDLLAAIRKQQHNRASGANGHPRPYVISVVGVNGVGKSTNLGKLAFWFLQNDFNVMVAACDTFRSGAVEQLKVHVQRLKQLKGRSNGEIELFDQGYGKDAAVIAKRAVEQATKQGFDVVLIDTAGRRHNDDRLMSSLEKFGNFANPDKIIMVGEALVGTDSVDQARNFDAAFGKSRGLDFFLISKCDTVGEMLGTLVNVTFATGVPVLFVGVGQQYTDLRTLSVDWAVDKLMR